MIQNNNNCATNGNPDFISPLGIKGVYSGKPMNKGVQRGEKMEGKTDLAQKFEYYGQLWKMKNVSSFILNTSRVYNKRRYLGKSLNNQRDKKVKVLNKDKKQYSSVCKCCTTPVNAPVSKQLTPGYVSYVKGEKGSNFFAGLQKCKGVWVCPLCAARISAERAEEVKTACEAWQDNGFNVHMVTFTIQHNKGESLKSLTDKITRGFNSALGHRQVKEERGNYHYIRGLEIKLGLSGWHPHIHVIFVARPESEYILQVIKSAYEVYIQNTGKNTVENITVKIDRWDKKIQSLTDYITKVTGSEPETELLKKWTIANEVTKGHSKTRKKQKGGVTPFEILLLIANREYNTYFALTGSRKPVADFRNYAENIYRRKQLQASKDFYLLRIEESKTDEEILQDDKIDSILFLVSHEIWNVVRKKNRVYDVAKAYEAGGTDAVLRLLTELDKTISRVNNVFKH